MSLESGVRTLDNRAELIARKNDAFRADPLVGGRLHLTERVDALGDAFFRKTIAAIQLFDSFTQEIDPTGEHARLIVVVEDRSVVFTIDYYADHACEAPSDDPLDETCYRIGTIALLESSFTANEHDGRCHNPLCDQWHILHALMVANGKHYCSAACAERDANTNQRLMSCSIRSRYRAIGNRQDARACIAPHRSLLFANISPATLSLQRMEAL